MTVGTHARPPSIDSCVQYTTNSVARAWLYREQLRDILDRKQPNVVHSMLRQWCTNVMRSKIEPMKEVAMLVRRHFDGIVAWSRTRQTNGFTEERSMDVDYDAAAARAAAATSGGGLARVHGARRHRDDDEAFEV